MPTSTTRALRHLFGVSGREWMTVDDVMRAHPTLWPTHEACRKWIGRHLAYSHRGHRVIVDRADLDRALSTPKAQAS